MYLTVHVDDLFILKSDNTVIIVTCTQNPYVLVNTLHTAAVNSVLLFSSRLTSIQSLAIIARTTGHMMPYSPFTSKNYPFWLTRQAHTLRLLLYEELCNTKL